MLIHAYVHAYVHVILCAIGICGPVVPLKVIPSPETPPATSAVRGEAIRGEEACGEGALSSTALPQYHSYADAMLFEPIPYRSAVAEGATHVLVLRTRPDEVNIVKKGSIFERLIAHRFFG